MNIKGIRSEYTKSELNEEHISISPFDQFKSWFKRAADMQVTEVNAMTLATAMPNGLPSARTVLLKDVDERGFVFYTNYEGRKGKELEQNPNAALLFYWKELEQQIRIEGKVEKLSEQESDVYFDERPLESRISAIISRQGRVVPNRRELEERWVNFLKNNYDKSIKRPVYWGGYRVIPTRIEFWQGRKNRLHDRILYTFTIEGWKIERLEP